MCEEESDDPEAVRKLLEINDSIYRTIQRYKLVKSGDFDAATRIPKGTLGTTTGVSKNANNELSLIDFDPEPSSNGAGQPAQGSSSIENDLLGLSIDEPVPSGGISLGQSMFFCPLHKLFTNIREASSPAPQIPQNHSAFQANYDILGSLNSSQRPSFSSTPAPAFHQPPVAATPPPTVDPFASLVSASPRNNSPLPSSSASPRPPASSSLLDLAGAGAEQKPKTTDDDEWNFTSSLPESSLPSTQRVQVLNSSLKIDFVARRHPQQQRQIHIVAYFSNATSQPLNDLHFQVAVEKVPAVYASLYYHLLIN
jgi:hypothetical protein